MVLGGAGGAYLALAPAMAGVSRCQEGLVAGVGQFGRCPRRNTQTLGIPKTRTRAQGKRLGQCPQEPRRQ